MNCYCNYCIFIAFYRLEQKWNSIKSPECLHNNYASLLKLNKNNNSDYPICETTNQMWDFYNMVHDIKRNCKPACKKLSYKGDISYSRGFSLNQREIGCEYLFVSDVIGKKIRQVHNTQWARKFKKVQSIKTS